MNLERLSFLRQDNDLRQIDIANILNVRQVSISNWKNTKEIIPLDKLNAYANYYNINMDYLVKSLYYKAKISHTYLTSWRGHIYI